MLVRFIKNCGVYQAGMVLDMPENVAMLYVKRGVAEYVQKMRVAGDARIRYRRWGIKGGKSF